VTPAPGGTGQTAETESTTTVTTTTTTALQEIPPTQFQDMPESGETPESTPKAALPVLITLFAILTVVILNGKE
jgi:hypothetical protein